MHRTKTDFVATVERAFTELIPNILQSFRKIVLSDGRLRHFLPPKVNLLHICKTLHEFYVVVYGFILRLQNLHSILYMYAHAGNTLNVGIFLTFVL